MNEEQIDDDNSAAGFASVGRPAATVDTPTETPGQQQAGEQASAEAEQVVEQAIEYAQITKDEYESLKARAAMIDEIKATQDRSFGTFGRTIQGMQDRITEFAAAPAVDISQEDIDTLRNEGFEPVASALEKIAKLRAVPTTPAAVDESKIEALVQQRIAPAMQTIEKRLLAREHPDYQSIASAPEFAVWVQAQPEAYRQNLSAASLAYDSEFVSSALTSFKQARAATTSKATPPQPTKKSRFAAAVTPRGSGQAEIEANDEAAGFKSAFR